MDWSRPIKKYLRDTIARFSAKNKKNALVLPADHALDVKELAAHGVINRDTTVLAVDLCAATLEKAKPLISTLVDKAHYHADYLEKFDLTAYAEKFGRVDLPIFDRCGTITQKIADWQEKHENAYMFPGSNVWFTLQVALRGRTGPGTTFFGIVDRNTRPLTLKAEINKIGPLKTVRVASDGSLYEEPATEKVIRALAVQHIGMRKLFPDFDFSIQSFSYRDQGKENSNRHGTPMTLLHLFNIQRKKGK